MRIFLFISIFISWTSSYGQLDKLKGTWVSPAQELIIVCDTVKNSNKNYLSNALLKDDNFELLIYGDTLSFQNRYTSSNDNYKKIYVDRYDLKIIRLTNKIIELKPVSEFSKKFFQNKDELIFTKQQYATDTSINFEKIIFHTTSCYGNCPIYHLQIDRSQSVLLHAAVDYTSIFRRDSTAEGYFKGKLSNLSFDKLLSALATCNLQTLKMNEVLCCDGVVYTIIVYYNGQRKYYKTMTPPQIVNELIKTLNAICREKNLLRINDKFKLED